MLTHLNHTPAIQTRRPGVTAHPDLNADGAAYTWWDDGIGTYVLAYTDGMASWVLADEVDTALQATEALRHGEHIPNDTLDGYLDVAFKLHRRIEALIDELVAYAREDDPDTGQPRRSWRQLAGGNVHHTTLHDRHEAAQRRRRSSWRKWLVQGGPRDDTGGLASTPVADRGPRAQIWVDPNVIRRQVAAAELAEAPPVTTIVDHEGVIHVTIKPEAVGGS